ncbi:hypothetical protein J3Q64DRAFT_1346419 [Phycomyces blakesleeanus]|uniref:Uncharacterized protein n=1 Tax=Phycomyces blakesleeanus TaxID=4837 RepID=A0ABR3AM41_PHYBL
MNSVYSTAPLSESPITVVPLKPVSPPVEIPKVVEKPDPIITTKLSIAGSTLTVNSKHTKQTKAATTGTRTTKTTTPSPPHSPPTTTRPTSTRPSSTRLATAPAPAPAPIHHTHTHVRNHTPSLPKQDSTAPPRNTTPKLSPTKPTPAKPSTAKRNSVLVVRPSPSAAVVKPIAAIPAHIKIETAAASAAAAAASAAAAAAIAAANTPPPLLRSSSGYRPRQTATVRARAEHAKNQQVLHEEEKRKAALLAAATGPRKLSRSGSQMRPKSTVPPPTSVAKDPIKVERRRTMPPLSTTATVEPIIRREKKPVRK